MSKAHFLRDRPVWKRRFQRLTDVREAVVVLSLLMSLRYLVWRVTQTINMQSNVHTAISVALLAAEVYGFVGIALFYFQSRRPKIVVPDELGERELPSVDVFVTIYNEPHDILYKTLVGCAAIDYPREKLNIYVLDDGRRDSIREMAESFGCRYLARQERKHAKAGNINFGLRNTHGEMVLILDCDHIPVRSILRETVGYFQDPKVAFVQMPHHFYNADIFQHNLHLDNELVHEQDLFFQVIVPGRQETNSVLFAGSSAVLRRRALESVGGMQTASAIEDTHTSMRLHAKGWKGVFHNKLLSGALSPESYHGYLTQRKRWARGGVQLFILDNPFLRPGLTLEQRLCHFSSLLYFFHGWARLIYLLSPLAFLLGSYDPIVCGTWTLLGYFLPHYLCAHLAVVLISHEFRNPFWSDVYEVASVFSLSWTALITVLQPDKLIFNVTPKGEAGKRPHRVHWTYVLPHAALIGLLLLGVVMATRRLMGNGLQLDSYSLSCLWAAFNIVLLGCAIEGSRERPQLRRGHRLDRRLACEVAYHGHRFAGTVRSLSESGCLVDLASDQHLPPVVHVRIFSDDYDCRTGLTGEATELQAEVVHQDAQRDGRSRLGARFTDMSSENRQSLLRQMFSAPNSWAEHERPFVSSWTAFWHIGTSLLRPRLRKPKRLRRARARIPVNVGATVSMGRVEAPVRLLDISFSGARIAASKPLPVAATLTLAFAVGEKAVRADCRRVNLKRVKGGPFEYGLKFVSPSHMEPALLEDMEDVAGV